MPKHDAKAKLATDKQISALKAEAGQYERMIATVNGLSIRVSQTGQKTFSLVYQLNGQKKRVTLGVYGQVTLEFASARAKEIRTLAKNGADFFAQPASQNENAKRPTFIALVPLYIAYGKTSKSWTDRTAKECEYVLRSSCRQLHGKGVDAIKKADIRKVLDDIMAKGKPSAANHAFADIRRFFNWIEKLGHFTKGDVTANPCHGIERPAPLRKRRVKLTDAEMGSVWLAAEKIGYPYGDMIRLQILTNVRRGIIASMKWKDIDLEKKRWTYKRKKHDAGDATIPLTDMAVAILSHVPKLKSEFVFPAKTKRARNAAANGADRVQERHFSGFSKAKKRLQALCGVKEDDVTFLANWRPHDFRRNFKTTMGEEQHAPRDVVEVMMDHTIPGVDGDYDLAEYMKPMAAAFPKWEEHLACVVEKERHSRQQGRGPGTTGAALKPESVHESTHS
jgi:integrase